MSKIRKQWLLAASMTLSVLGATVPVRASAPPDATLFTTYEINSTHTDVSWIVCGSTAQSEGCFDSGSLGPFGKVGALMEGSASTNLSTNTVTRAIYVLDIATGSSLTGVTLYVYKKTDTITSSFDTTSVILFKTISLPLVGGTSALASMAANSKFLFIGTNKSPEAVEIQKGTFTMSQFGGFSPPINVAGITADPYGYVTITFGSFNTSSNGFIVFNPEGAAVEDGGGAPFMLNTVQAVLPSTFH
jgi:hypothetical protein